MSSSPPPWGQFPCEPGSAPFVQRFSGRWDGRSLFIHRDESPFEPIPPPVESHWPITSLYPLGMKKKKITKLEKLEAMKKQEEERERLLKEQERLTSLSFKAHTESFTKKIRELCLTSPSLKSLSVCQLGRSFQFLLKPATLPEDMLRTMLVLPAIESLEVEGWILDSVEGVLSAIESIPNLKSLLLPSSEPNSGSGISLPTLRHVAKTCPKLESFQCYIDPLSPVPEYSSSIPTDVGLSHGLRILSVGSFFPLPFAKKLGYLIARHLYLLFPDLETIRTSGGHDAELWVDVDDFVKIFQTARMDDLNRQ
jgi:hypothetical protein